VCQCSLLRMMLDAAGCDAKTNGTIKYRPTHGGPRFQPCLTPTAINLASSLYGLKLCRLDLMS
jgi:hypothetical protein